MCVLYETFKKIPISLTTFSFQLYSNHNKIIINVKHNRIEKFENCFTKISTYFVKLINWKKTCNSLVANCTYIFINELFIN